MGMEPLNLHHLLYGVGSTSHIIWINDLNNDNNTDLVNENYNSNTVSILMGNGDGTFKPEATYSVGINPHGTAVAEISMVMASKM